MATMKKLFYCTIVMLFFISACQKSEKEIPEYNITCYAATYSEGIYKSDNGGKSWYPMKFNQEDLHLYFKRLFLSPDKKTLYIGTTGAGLFTVDLKNEILQRIEQFKGQNIRTVTFTDKIDSGKQDVLVGMFDEGISKIDYEKSKDNFLNNGLTYRDVNTIITTGNDIFAGTAKDIFKWDNKSKKWLASSGGIKNKNIISMASTPKGDILFAGSGGYYNKKGMFESVPCLYVSKDNGKTWEDSDDGLPGDTLVYTIAVNKSVPERIYLGTSNGVFMSDDSGDEWSKTDNGLPDDFRVFDIRIYHVTDGNDVVYAAGSKGVFMAEDNDDPEWTDKNYGLPKTNITAIAVN